ncbi:MAG: MlaD family protein [Vampirovibrionales bacterium]
MSANHRDQTIRTAALKVGFLTVVAIGLLMGVLGWLRGRSLWSGASYTVLFPDVDGLKESAPVQMMGIRVGFVDSVTPEVRHGRYQVRVQFNLGNQSIHIPIGSLLSIQQSGLIGEKFLEITPPEEHHCQLSTSVALQKPLPLWAEYQQGAAIVGQLEAITPNHKGVYRLSRNNLSPANYCYYRQGESGGSQPLRPP